MMVDSMQGPAAYPSAVGTFSMDSELRISRSALLRSVEGVAAATTTSRDDVKPILQYTQLCNDGSTSGISLRDWCTVLLPKFAESDKLSKQIASLALGVSFLREHSRQIKADGISAVDETNSALVWSLIHGALTSPLLPRPLCRVSRSAQGFLAFPLCLLIENGDIDKLFCPHV